MKKMFKTEILRKNSTKVGTETEKKKKRGEFEKE